MIFPSILNAGGKVKKYPANFVFSKWPLFIKSKQKGIFQHSSTAPKIDKQIKTHQNLTRQFFFLRKNQISEKAIIQMLEKR